MHKCSQKMCSHYDVTTMPKATTAGMGMICAVSPPTCS